MYKILDFYYNNVIYNNITYKIFCDISEYYQKCSNIWKLESSNALYIPAKEHGFFKKLFTQAPHRSFCDPYDAELGLYGHGHAILTYCGVDKSAGRFVTAEHGNILRDVIPAEHLERYRKKLVLTFSPSRSKFLQSQGIRSVAVGPYIHYASLPNTKKQIRNLKTLLGRTVVHFPLLGPNFHTESDLADIDHELCSQTLYEWKSKGLIDTIVVCHRSLDILNSHRLLPAYENIGAIKACCGDITNPFFQNHTRLLIELSTLTTSNAVSTPLGNSVFLGKPHLIIGGPNLEGFEYKQQDQNSKYLHDQLYSTSDVTRFDLPVNSLLERISELWGFSSTFTKSQLNQLLNQHITSMIA